MRAQVFTSTCSLTEQAGSVSYLLSSTFSLSVIPARSRSRQVRIVRDVTGGIPEADETCILYRPPCNDAFADCCTLPGMLQYRRKTGSNRIEG
jgi:hypothetical protein